MSDEAKWYVRSADGSVYGPADMSSLVKWAEDGRVDPSSFVSRDRKTWVPAQLMDELAMTWLVEVEPGRVLGPYNRRFLIASHARGELAPGIRIYRRHELPVDEDPPPRIVEKIVEKPVEKIVEKIVEVEKGPRTTVIEAVVAEPVDVVPPSPSVEGGIFGGVDRARLAALEKAARKEMAAVGARRFGFFGGKKL